MHHLHRRPEASAAATAATAASRSSLAPSGTPTVAAAAAAAAAAASPAALQPAADDEARNAAAQMPRNRRVRFATVPSAREYRELSPYKEAGPTPTSSAAAMGAAVPPSCAAHISYPQEEAAAAGGGGGGAAAEQPRVAAADNHVSGGVCSRSTSLLNQMTQMVQRLLNYPPLQQHQESKVGIQITDGPDKLLFLLSYTAAEPSLSVVATAVAEKQ
ncbi:hypothetical protein, conserved [Eimeria praecox]|uniref:Uncharacterized protein n=1 Tax=Eimeria praecox TaxID=51316 RepID=U6G5M6_9EIME|nr:hypothetical protein, conserved [Eimeria praecox]